MKSFEEKVKKIFSAHCEKVVYGLIEILGYDVIKACEVLDEKLYTKYYKDIHWSYGTEWEKLAHLIIVDISFESVQDITINELDMHIKLNSLKGEELKAYLISKNWRIASSGFAISLKDDALSVSNYLLDTAECKMYSFETIEQCIDIITNIYAKSDVILSETLASLNIVGLDMEQVFELYRQMKTTIDGDHIAVTPF